MAVLATLAAGLIIVLGRSPITPAPLRDAIRRASSPRRAVVAAHRLMSGHRPRHADTVPHEVEDPPAAGLSQWRDALNGLGPLAAGGKTSGGRKSRARAQAVSEAARASARRLAHAVEEPPLGDPNAPNPKAIASARAAPATTRARAASSFRPPQPRASHIQTAVQEHPTPTQESGARPSVSNHRLERTLHPAPARQTIARSAYHGPAPFPLFNPPARRTPKLDPAASKTARRPPSLSQLLGRGARRPPKSSLTPPSLSRTPPQRPLQSPSGAPVPATLFPLGDLERINPGSVGEAACRRQDAHWHQDRLWHDGANRGLIEDNQWLWLLRRDRQWWAVPEPSSPALVYHQQLWWAKINAVWLALHEGELWSWRRFAQWNAEGLLRLIDGTQIVYSADFSRIAVVTPGEGAVLYDALHGTELGRWHEHEMPHPRPKAPTELRLPRGI